MASIHICIDKDPSLETRIKRINDAIDGELSILSDTKGFLVFEFPYTGFIDTDILTVLAEESNGIIVC